MDPIPTEILMRELNVIVADAEELLNSTAHQTGASIDMARARVEQSLRAARKTLRAQRNKLDYQAHKHPWATAAIIGVVGLTLGVLLTSRR